MITTTKLDRTSICNMADLRARGWSDKMAKQLLSPHKISKEPSTGSMRYWPLDEVERAEQSSAFAKEKTHFQDHKRRVALRRAQKADLRRAKENAEIEQAIRILPRDAYETTFPLARATQKEWKFYHGPTNSGKTYRAKQEMLAAGAGTYLGPLRLLALEVADALNDEGYACSLITGEERKEIQGARFSSRTIEMLNLDQVLPAVIVDEVQMLADPERGWAWTQALLGAPASKVLIAGNADALPLVRQLAKRAGVPLSEIPCERMNPLEVVEQRHVSHNGEFGKGTAIIAFSRHSVLEARDNLLNKGRTVATLYGSLTPEVRRREAKRFSTGEAQVLVATDAIGMGLNLPIQHIHFAELAKFDGQERRLLLPDEIRQIAGRSGRHGFHEKGTVSWAGSAKVLNGLMQSPGREIPLQAPIKPSQQHIQKLSEAINESRLTILLEIFQRTTQIEDLPFRCSFSSNYLDWAAKVDRYKSLIPLSDRFVLAQMPLPADSPFISSYGMSIIERVSGAFRNSTSPQRDLADWGPCSDDSQRIEDELKMITAYRWVHYHWPLLFEKLTAATTAYAIRNDKLCELLRSRRKMSRQSNRHIQREIENELFRGKNAQGKSRSALHYAC